jgi:hypothetical protein
VPFPPLEARGLVQVYDGADARVYRIEGALPRAWVVGAQRVVADDDAALEAVTRPGFDARGVTITDHRLPGLPEVGAPGAATGTAGITSYGDERVVLRVRSSGPGVVVLSDTHYPGWKAKVDGRSADVERVDYTFRGVRIGPGEHTVELRYQPLSFRLGAWVSVLALVGLLAAAAVGRRRRRAGAGPPRPPAEDATRLERAEPART